MEWLARLVPGGLLVLLLAGVWIASGGTGGAQVPAKAPAASAAAADLNRAPNVVAQLGTLRTDVLDAVQSSSARASREQENATRVVIGGLEQLRVDMREMQADLSRQIAELRKTPKPPLRRRAKTSDAPKPITNTAWPYTITYATGHGRPRA